MGDHDAEAAEEWSGVEYLSEIKGSGRYYLTRNVSLAGVSYGGAAVDNSGAFALYGGTIRGNTGGPAVSVSSTGTFTMTGGSIASNTVTEGSVYLSAAGSVFQMSGGAITGNTAATYDGGVYIRNGAFTMSGGTIRGNSTEANGGGVYNAGAFHLYGGSITGNTATNGGGGVCNVLSGGSMTVSGAVTITGNTVNGKSDNLYLPYGKTIAISGSLDQNTVIGVTPVPLPAEKSIAIAEGVSAADMARCFLDAGDADKYEFYVDGTTLKLKVNHTHD